MLSCLFFLLRVYLADKTRPSPLSHGMKPIMPPVRQSILNVSSCDCAEVYKLIEHQQSLRA